MSTRIRVHRCHCRACGRSYAVFRLAGDVKGCAGHDRALRDLHRFHDRVSGRPLRDVVMPIRMRVKLSPPLAETLPLRTGLRRELPSISDDLAGDIRHRTEGGRDAHGRRFARRRDGSPSNLIDSGDMVRSFRPVRVDDRGFVLAPTGRRERQKAYFHMTGRGGKKREWVGLDRRQIDQAVQDIAEARIPKDR